MTTNNTINTTNSTEGPDYGSALKQFVAERQREVQAMQPIKTPEEGQKPVYSDTNIALAKLAVLGADNGALHESLQQAAPSAEGEKPTVLIPAQPNAPSIEMPESTGAHAA